MLKKEPRILLKMNDKGPKVREAQELLKKAGSTIKVTGVFSIGMYSAVKAFQKKQGLKATGAIDEGTLKVLMAFKVKKPPRKIVKMGPKKK